MLIADGGDAFVAVDIGGGDEAGAARIIFRQSPRDII